MKMHVGLVYLWPAIKDRRIHTLLRNHGPDALKECATSVPGGRPPSSLQVLRPVSTAIVPWGSSCTAHA